MALQTVAHNSYSYGMVLFELMTRKLPFEGMEYGAILYHVAKADARPYIEPGFPQDLRDLITKCWDQTPGSRPDIQEILHGLHIIEAKYIREEEQELSTIV